MQANTFFFSCTVLIYAHLHSVNVTPYPNIVFVSSLSAVVPEGSFTTRSESSLEMYIMHKVATVGINRLNSWSRLCFEG